MKLIALLPNQRGAAALPKRRRSATRHLANKDRALAYPLDELPSADQFMLDAYGGNKRGFYVFDLEKRQITLHTAIGRYILGKAIELGIKVYYAQDWKVYKEKN
jgi:hypothetical protein